MFTMKIKKYVTPVKRKAFNILQWISLLCSLWAIPTVQSKPDERHSATLEYRLENPLQDLYRFSHNVYNVTIPENSLGKTYAKGVLHERLAGMRVGLNSEVKYRIISGDKEKLFKAEEKLVGDFAFLAIRTRTNNVVLNREKTEEYVIRVKAHVHFHERNISSYETEANIHIRVLDRNDLSPLFYPTQYTVVIPEDTPKYQSILKVTADDADLGINGEIYYSLLMDSEHFAIHPTTGEITLLQQLQYAENSHFELTVLAYDRGSWVNHQNHQASKAKVSISVKQVNFYAPEIFTKTFSSVKPTSNPLIYGIVRVNDKDTGIDGNIGRLEIVDGNPDGTFLLKAAETKDEYYIELNQFAHLNQQHFIYNLTLRAEDLGTPRRFAYKSVPIHITPESKNIPIFTQEIYEVSIPETAPINMPVIRLKVSDPDLGKNALVYLEIVGGNEGDEFRINPDSGMLYTAKRLDAEKKSSYTLTVSAIDQANVGSRKQSSAKVKISVQDMNDNDPIFENVNKIISINENNLAGSFVVKLTAKDRDSGENSYISYSIANLNTVPFEIDHFSGIVKTTSQIDYETMKRNYELIIRASDWGLPYRRQTEVKLSIAVKDINDNRPQFERVNCYGKVTKSAPMGTEVFVTSAIDFDAGDIVSYRLSDGNEDGCFNLDPTSGSLSISCDLKKTSLTNRILKASATDGTHFSDELIINVHIMPEDLGGDSSIPHGFGSFECRETGVARRLVETLALAEKNNVKSVSPSVFSDLSLTPSRYGQNVHRPEFINFPQELSINESVQLGETVAWIEAKDRDLGYNGKLVFAISDGDYDSVFRIDPDRGELQIIGYLDRERQNEYVLNITVYDLGSPTKSTSKMLPITILDVNDNRPAIQKTLATFRLTESARIGTVVHCVHATDADSGVNAQVTYALSVECSDFTVNATTGCIRLNKPLDREKQDNYALHITAKDGGNPVLSSEALVYVLVDDVNDNAPVFGVQEYIFKVREDLPRGTVLAVIEAVDEDIGPNAEILFSLKEETSDEELFRIDKHTGAIRTQGYLDYENKQVHNLIVSAIDGGDPSLTSDMSIVIMIIDVNENRFSPEFEDFVYEGKIKENKPKGTFVMNVTARDMDTVDLNSKITYSITGGDGLGIFAVNDQGLITSLTQLDAETKNFYWLTLCAQDCAIVPLSNCVEVYVEVENENDNIPLTDKPVYYVNVTEASAENVEIITLNAMDPDIDPTQSITYNIVSGNLVGYFEIDSKTGVITTTERKLDRENQAEHILEVAISDNGSPVLSSTSRIVVSVLDINDNSPEFDQRVYKVQVPSSATVNQSIFQVHAIDNDSGENGRITYSIKSGKGKNKFRIDSQRGHIHIAKPLESDNEFEIHIKAEDNGIPKKSQTARVNIVVVPVNPNSQNAPLIVKKTSDNVVDLTENDKPGFLVTQILAVDDDNDQLWYNISNGNEDNTFYIGQDNGNILLSKYLDYETQKSYNLTISVTDGTFSSFTHLLVQVIDINDNPPQFPKDVYHVNISENIEEESVIMQLHATDRDEDKKLFYHLHATQDPSSLALFRIDSISGNVIVTQRLDFEKTAQHILIVFVKDQGAPGKRNYAKIIVNVHDHNDHHPEFTSKIIQSKVPESAAIGSKLAEVRAIDRDSGHNAEIQYSIISGNVGSVFEIDPTFGIITLAGSLNINKIQEYMLQVIAADRGSPPLASQIPVHIIVTMSENDPPKFLTNNIAIEIFENLGIGTFVTQVTARSSSSIFYNIISGNTNESFRINPSTGVIVINGNIDYEIIKVFNLTVKGTNMAAESSCQNIIIHILDANDNIPYFVQNEYVGALSESAAIGSYVLKVHDSSKDHLTLQVKDADVGVNGIVEYHINDDLAKNVFKIDSTTGAIELLRHLDYETNAGYTFDVTVSDMGKPKLHSTTTAHVTIRVINVNDCPPEFNERELNVTLFLPTFENVFVAQINAKDADNDTLRFDVVDGNTNECFQIDKYTGIITTRNFEILNNENDQDYSLHIRASDGIFSAILIVKIKVLSALDSNFAFQRESYRFSAFENNTKVATIGLVNVIGNSLNENVEYRILNPTKLFDIGISSGALKTTGVIFDREVQDLYRLFVEAKSVLFDGMNSNVRRAVTSVYISVLDVNDNCPLFVNMPYYATVSIDDPKGTIIMQVKAVDLDSAENGEVRYELKKGNGELFKLDRKTGELSIKQHVEGHNRNYELTVAAYDGAITPCSSEAPLQVKVIDRSMPVFEKQFYTVSVKEDVEMYSALSVSIEAESPLGRSLIYTISSDSQSFEIDYNTGSIFVVNELDYEQMNSHDVSIRATDSLSGVYAEVVLSVSIIDVNDCYPEIESDIYNITIPENSVFGTQILKINATDKDSGANAKLSYYIESINGQNNSELFYIDVTDGNLFLKSPLDYEQTKYHHIVVNVKDHGSPSLSSRSNVFITVKDLNDNPPCFVEPSYFTKLSVAAVRGQFVALPKAYDKDISDTDSLEYKIVYGNELQTYSIDKLTGVISLQNMLNFTDKSSTVLNISVSDGVHTAYARLKISLLPENVYSPQFEQSAYEANIPENLLHGHNIITVKATDGDFGTYSNLYYEIVSEEMKKFFLIDQSTGVVTSKVTFDREKRDEYVVLLKVSDGGGKFGFASLKVMVVDVNDNVPYFLLKEYKIVVSTTTEANKTILTVKAKDDDINENGSVYYQIVQKSIDEASKNVIDINEKTGDIVLKEGAGTYGVGTFQFFVRASDRGEPKFHSEVPVSVEIIETDASIPVFEKSSLLLKIIESTSPGTVLTKLHMVGNFTIKFSIAADQDHFMISDSGELILQQTLDREQQESHNLIVVAETSTVPVLFAYADVLIEVRDENDNYPKFDNTFYSASVAENSEKVISLVKVSATDADTGPNGDIRYYLESDTENIQNIFDIDIYSGWITLLTSLDREVQSEYNFKVIAADNGHPKHDAKVPVTIKIVDYNDNAPAFKLPIERIAVFENALPGTVLINLLLIDPDIEKQEMDFFIVSGDKQAQFQIGKSGELFIAKPLDREQIMFYNLSIIATDGKFTAKANVEIDVKDINDNTPYCLKPRYHISTNESISIGTTLVEIEAVDFDLQSKLRFYLSGKGADDFTIGKESGILKVVNALDRETTPKYKLVAHVQDGKDFTQECFSEVIITVNDINDNIPVFSMAQYRVSVPEDAQLNTLITKVHAMDKDFGVNRQIKYSLMGENHDYFKISKSTGIIRLDKNLDRETISLFNLTVKAEDCGVPKLHSIATVAVNILDINDNPPEFSMRQYSCKVLENATHGTEVCRVFAASIDIGVNADIHYYIMSGNEQGKFKMDSMTGDLVLNATLDYEMSKFYFLTIQAIDGGTPPLSNNAYVNVSILDINDNSPKFLQNLYRINVNEDIFVGSKILDIKATDEDSDINGLVTYNIEKGDNIGQFSIDQTNGTISVSRPLDRETISHYNLEIQACDQGVPQRCNSVPVNINILDTNDNAPIFSSANYSVVLQENRPLGYIFLTFKISDADESPNTTPYTFDIRSGNEGGLFRLEQDGSLSTASRFNHNLQDEFVIQVRVFDNGTPPLYSDAWVVVKIIEESQYPPIVTPLEVTINSFEDDFSGAFIGKVHASDQDKYDELNFSLVSGSEDMYQSSKLFNISSKTGKIYAISNLDIGLYKLNVSVSDGKYNVFSIVKINVELVTNDMLKESVVIRFSRISASEFLLSHRKTFMRSIRNIMRCRQKDVILITLQPEAQKHSVTSRHARSVDSNLNVVFAVRKQQIIPDSDEFFTSDEIRQTLIDKKNEIENETNLVVEDILPSSCQSNKDACVHGECKQTLRIQKNNVTTTFTDVISFAAPSYNQVNRCVCRPGFDGKHCNETVNACSTDPCSPQRICMPSGSVLGYQCVCPKGFSGTYCERKSSKCSNESCDMGLFTAVSFGGKSYAHYKINKIKAKFTLENEFSYSLQIRTVQQTGTLLYASGKVDYNILEIINGAVQYRFDLGSGEGVISVSSINISDGEWHLISLERSLNSAKVMVDNKHVSHGSAPGVNGILNIQSNDIFVGAEVRPHPSIIGYEDIQRGFIGCMANIKIAKESLPLYISGGSTIAALKRFTNVEFKCDPSNVLVRLGICGSQPCANSGICKELDTDVFECACQPRYSGKHCEIDLDPCSSGPCLFGGRCDYHGPNNYSCTCPIHLSGRRCEYGKFCTPNPCKNGGICEEGDGISHCMCRGYTGPTCEIDVDECENQPCGNGATCINEPGSFRCICPSYLTGASCGDPLYSNSISTKLKNFSLEHISGIISGVAVVLVIISCVLCCVVIRRNSSSKRRNRLEKDKNKPSYKEANLNSLVDKDNYCKPNVKLSNLEVNQRPISYTAAPNDNLFLSNRNFVNNLDILRSYGSAGDELENVPFEYQKVNRNKQHVNINSCHAADADNAYKQEWCEQMHLRTFSENKLNNELKRDFGPSVSRFSTGKLIQVEMPNVCHSSSANFVDYSALANGQYHWDCSDWVRKSHNPLPDITEVPGAEIADSSSLHSNDSNESKSKKAFFVHREDGDVDPTRDIAALNEDIGSEYLDSEAESCLEPFMLPRSSNQPLSRLSSFNNIENEDYKSNTVPLPSKVSHSCKVYLRHPDSYLPTMHFPSETDGESSMTEGPISRKEMKTRRTISENSEEAYLFPCAVGEIGSNSNISVRLCEIEDSELEEFLPQQQTNN
ncbi:fat-like cadherin-related tumor suppressor homolog isoform X1 [Drosophila biarmipes]|uniref:fat-like cadherin-related tumor suppressor homolog isoform X1 n=1 Tax=Drosophila biarmipes TaxID=125945 RepID=UPI0007E88E96|nr:fat-like cadherin-related tumor suppressor homolog isoform X1 [Drosophila biarmipes]XP_043951201.1 fat-like cadherin-related tumor suppressor homolog isoform X1 [Drosophila biarmipes]